MDQILQMPGAPASRCWRPWSGSARGVRRLVPLAADTGFARVEVDGTTYALDEVPKLRKQVKHSISVVVDRLVAKKSGKRRLTDTVETAFTARGGVVVIDLVDLEPDDPQRQSTFSEHLACMDDGLSFEEIEPRSFSFNSPFGACAECDGLGTRMEVDPELVIPDPGRSLAESAIAPMTGSSSSEYFQRLMTALAENCISRWIRRMSTSRLTFSTCCCTVAASRSLSAIGTGMDASGPTPLRVGGCDPVRRASSRFLGVRHDAGTLRGLYARHAMSGLPGRPPETAEPGGDDRWPQHRRDRGAADRRVCRIPGRCGTRRPGGADRRTGSQGGERPTAVPDRRRVALSDPGPGGRHPGRGEAQRIRLATQIGSGLVGCCTSWTNPASACTSATITG